MPAGTGTYRGRPAAVAAAENRENMRNALPKRESGPLEIADRLTVADHKYRANVRAIAQQAGQLGGYAPKALRERERGRSSFNKF